MQSISVKHLTFFVPDEEKSRIMEIYGDMTFADFDAQGFNDAIGKLYPGAKLASSYMSIYSWVRKYEPRELYDKLGDEWSDMFNIVHSEIQTSKGQQIWYF